MSNFVYGFHVIQELLKKGGVDGSLFYSKKSKKYNDLIMLAQKKGLHVEFMHDDEISNMCGNSDHRGILLVVKEIPLQFKQDLRIFLKAVQGKRALVIVLDSITDPHNLGAILRSCDQFAVDLVIIPQKKAAHETQTVLKTSHHTVNLLKKEGFWVYGADMHGRSLSKIDLSGRIALILGSEGKGLGHLLKGLSDELIAIPAKGHVDSFNVSVAAGIMLYEVRRQQGWL
jgi:23S rRNA (guanosine2251-2'-O)-methyltransferase